MGIEASPRTHAREVHIGFPRLEYRASRACKDEARRLAVTVVGSLPLSPSDQTRFELAGPALAQDVDHEARHDYASLGLRLESFADEEADALAQPVDARSHR